MGGALNRLKRWHEHLFEKVERAGAGSPLNTERCMCGNDVQLDAMAQPVGFPLFLR